MKHIVYILFITNILLITPNSSFCQSQPCTYPTIDNRANITLSCPGTLMINGKIDGQSTALLISESGSCVINEKIDGQSNVTIICKHGNVSINGKIDGASTVTIKCDGDITIGEKIDGAAVVDFYTENGRIIIKDYVGNLRTVIRYHSKYAPIWGNHCDTSPQKY